VLYGVTEVFIKHDYFSNLKIRIVRKEGERFFLQEYLGDKLNEIEEIEVTEKLYPIPENFLAFNPGKDYFYIYNDTNCPYSFYRYKYIKHVGSSRSSKSWSIEEKALRDCEQIPNFRFTVWRDTQTSLGNTVWKDFRKLMPLSGRNYKFPRNTQPIHLANGSVIEPHGDDTTNAHGLTQNKAWLNEPYLMSKDTFDQIDQRAEQIIIDINPTGAHWSDKLEENPRCKVIHSTFMENPFCPLESRLKILSYDPSNSANIENGTADEYKWQVYGLGLKAEKPNRIFHWKKCTDEFYNNLQSKEYLACDWGKSDPWGVIGGKYYDGAIYFKEYNYLSENEWNEINHKKGDIYEKDSEGLGIVQWLFEKHLRINKTTHIDCDHNRPLKIAMLRRCGYESVFPAIKGNICDGIDILDSIDVFYTESSKNIEFETEMYEWEVDRYGIVIDSQPIDKHNHLMDGARYIARRMTNLGLIVKI